MESQDAIIKKNDLILVTGATGFIGSRVVESLLSRGFCNIRCLARPLADSENLEAIIRRRTETARIVIFKGDLLSREDCLGASEGAKVIYHLAAGRGKKLFADAFLNSVVTTRNLLEATLSHRCLMRFVTISSFSVYSNAGKPRRGLLDESYPIESHPELQGDAYSFAKVKQDELVNEYGRRFDIPYVIVRPGFVYGPGNEVITGRVGIGTFGVFLHMGGSNTIPLTYVDNCADAIVLAGLKPGVEGEVFNVVDDDLPTSRTFLRAYKRNVRHFNSIWVPRMVSYSLCYLWEKYSDWSQGQLPPAFNRRTWHAYWKKTRYTNKKLKTRLGWNPAVPTSDALGRYFESCRHKVRHA